MRALRAFEVSEDNLGGLDRLRDDGVLVLAYIHRCCLPLRHCLSYRDISVVSDGLVYLIDWPATLRGDGLVGPRILARQTLTLVQ